MPVRGFTGPADDHPSRVGHPARTLSAIGFATTVMPLGTAIAVFSTLAHVLMIVMLLVLPETRGRAIASLEAEAPSAAA